MKQSGFTLVELVVVITIIVVLGTIAYLSSQDDADRATQKAKLKTDCVYQGKIFNDSSQMCQSKFEYCADRSKDAAILQICLDQLK